MSLTRAAFIAGRILPAAVSLLPERMTSPDATRMLLAIGWQESRFEHRRQIRGPARSWWQFERAGVGGVMSHPASSFHAERAAILLGYVPQIEEVHVALEHNDVLAAAFARLLLWTLPEPLPTTQADGWSQYIRAWRPGKPHPRTWAQAWRHAEELTR